MTREEKFELLSRYLDDTLQEGDVQTVEELLRNDPEFARALADVSLQHSLLYRLGKTDGAVPVVAEPQADSREGSGIHRASPRRRAQARRMSGRVFASSPWLRVAVPLAACLLIFIVAMAVLPGDPRPPAAPAAKAPEPVRRTPPTPPRRAPQPAAPKAAAPVETPVPRAKPPAPAPLPQAPRVRTPEPPAPTPEPVPPRTSPPTRKTTITLATLRDLSGTVWITEGAGIEKGPVSAGQILEPGQGIRTAPDGHARVVYPDGSVLEIRGNTEIREFTLENGKRSFLAKGSVSAQVERQARGTSMVITTPHADVRVVGTRFTVRLSPEVTRLSVTEGRVKFTRREDGRFVTVPAGFMSAAGAGLPFKPTPIRPAAGLAALYRFDEARGTIIRDVSRNGTALDLTIADPKAVQWRPGALAVTGAAVIRSSRSAARIAKACRRTNELSVEAWVRPAAATTPDAPEPGRIVTCSTDLNSRNFCLEQGGPRGAAPGDLFNMRLRTSNTNSNGFPPLFATPTGTARPRLIHIVYARSASGDAVFFLDGREVARRLSAGDFGTWDDSYPLVLADELGGKRPWAGEYHALAIYTRALTPEEVKRLSEAGPE